MAKYSKEKLELVRAKLRGFERLERRNTDAAGWVALAFSVTRREAEKLIKAAAEES